MVRAVHWFRNDLRLRDNTALIEATRGAHELVALFVLDDHLLRRERAGAPRVRFLLDGLARLAAELEGRGSRLVVRRGDPVQEVPRLLAETRADLLAWNRDTTPYARRRDEAVRAAAGRLGVRAIDAVDRVVFEADQVQKTSGGSYAVYSPFQRAWYARLADGPREPRPAPRLPPPVAGVTGLAVPAPDALGLGDDGTALPSAGSEAARRRLRRFLETGVRHYDRDRERPGVDGTSRLSPYLRFGAISVRECVHEAREAAAAEPGLGRGARKWVDELVWREFHAAVLQDNPRILREPYRREFASLAWRNDPEEVEAWCEGRTGYPIVDAGMRQLREIGWMHNRVRMIAASFLTKDLLADWRIGERFFFGRLVDGDPASNNGGWQWAASTGTDPQPFFRIFNPVTQGRRFDPDGAYVRRYLPELAGLPDTHVHSPWEASEPPAGYPAPLVSHAERRVLALEAYAKARSGLRSPAARGRKRPLG